MYNDAVKMALMDGDFDEEEDPDFTDDIMDKIEVFDSYLVTHYLSFLI